MTYLEGVLQVCVRLWEAISDTHCRCLYSYDRLLVSCLAGVCRAMTEKQMVQFCKTGTQTALVNSVGLYHYKIPEVVDNLPTSTVLAEAGETVSLHGSGQTQSEGCVKVIL